MNDFYDWDDCTKQHIFDKDAVNSDNPAFLWGSDQLVEARAENERLTARLKVLQKAAIWTGNGKWKRIMIDEGTEIYTALWGGDK